MFMYFYLLLTRGNCVTQLRSFPAMTAIHSIEQLSDAVDIVNEHVQESGHSAIYAPDEGLEKATLVREKEGEENALRVVGNRIWGGKGDFCERHICRPLISQIQSFT